MPPYFFQNNARHCPQDQVLEVDRVRVNVIVAVGITVCVRVVVSVGVWEGVVVGMQVNFRSGSVKHMKLKFC